MFLCRRCSQNASTPPRWSLSKKCSAVRSYPFFSLYDPIATVPDEAISHIIFGSDELFRVGEGNLSELVSFSGIVDDIDDKVECPVCHGTRLNENANCFRIDGKTISEVAAMEMSDLKEWLSSLPSKLNDRENNIARDILKELGDRVKFMLDVGLDYLWSAPLFGGRMHLELELGVGYIWSLSRPYDCLSPGDKIYHRKGVTQQTTWFGPTRAQISLVVPIYSKGGKR